MAKKAKENNKKKSTKDDKLNLDNEIIIGIKTLPEPDVPNSKKKKTTNKNKKQARKKQTKVVKNKKRKTPKELEIAKRKRMAIFRIVKWTAICVIFIGGGICFLLSPYFNITEIEVAGNKKITKEEIISLSGILLNENTFKIQSYKAREQIMENAYIDAVDVKRQLPNKINIEVVEREPTFMLSFGNAYIYINNQGYLLEVSQTALKVPIITGYFTEEDELHPGNRLCSEDLQRLDSALQIMKSAESNNLAKLITKINIEDKQDYILELKSEKKKVHIGDSTNLSTKMLYVVSILEENKKVEGEIFVNTDLNNKGAIFRKKI